MTEKEFLASFERHLHVAEPKRSEIITEIKNHLKDNGTSGDPKALALELNRAHLGFFSSFQKLVLLRIGVLLLLEIFTLNLILVWAYNNYLTSPIPLWYNSLYILCAVMPYIFVVLGPYAISHLHRRWRFLLYWILLLLGLGFALRLIQQGIGYLNYANSNLDFFTGYWPYFKDDLLSFVAVSVGIMLLSLSRQRIVPRHPLLDLIAAFIIQGVAGYFLVPIVANIFNISYGSLYNNLAYPMNVWLYGHQDWIAVVIGLVGAFIELHRLRSQLSHQKPM